MKKYKARITEKHLQDFINRVSGKENCNNLDHDFHEKFDYHWDEYNGMASECHDLFLKAFGLKYMSFHTKGELDKEIETKLRLLIAYMESNNAQWNVDFMEEKFMLISFSGNQFFWLADCCELQEMPDYDGLTMAELRSIGTDQTANLLPVEMNSLSVNAVRTQKETLEKNIYDSQKELDDIRHNKLDELAKLEAEISKIQSQLDERKNELQRQINEKIAAMNEQIAQMNKQIYMMESEIYTIRSYSGETCELNKIRNGKRGDISCPLVVNQKLMYLDEDLARMVSVYQHEISRKFELFADAVKGCDEVFESFCPQERCITFFRLSNNATYKWYNGERHMYETEELIHGKKMGFLLRDGECAYIGWLDEEWGRNADKTPRQVSFTGELMYKPQKSVEIREAGEGDELKLKADSKNTMLSRVFAISVVQGILDNKNILLFPERVNVMKPSAYITYNYADGWIMDDRFGDFATLVANLNKRTKVNDPILITYNKNYCQGRGENDRAHDCKVPEGINKVNYLESDEYGNCVIYVSAEKKWSSCGATANVKICKNEYINIAYMNSVWLSYYVQTKKMGRYVEDYAKMIKHFKRAIEIIKERESVEIAAIKKYYPQADSIPEWEVKISHWKLHNNIRFITDYQAKRIARYFEKGEFIEIKNLFLPEPGHNEQISSLYSRTNFTYPESVFHESKEGYGSHSDYAEQSFYIHLVREWNDEDKEKNRITLAKELPEKEALVPERIIKDVEKLELVKTYVMDFLLTQHIDIVDFLNVQGLPDFLYKKENSIEFQRLDELEKQDRERFFAVAANKYPSYILQSECWKVAYYDYIQLQYTELLYQAKLYLHKCFMEDIIIV